MSRSDLRAEDGMSMVEAMVAIAVLIVGLLATFVVLDGSRELTTVSERKQVAVHRAEDQLERLKTISFARLELVSAPVCPAPCSADDPRAQVTGTNYDWDASSATNAVEPLVVVGATPNPDAITSHTTWSDGRFAGTLDVFVTTAGTDLKRVTVAVKLDGASEPRRPILLSTLVSRQAAP